MSDKTLLEAGQTYLPDDFSKEGEFVRPPSQFKKWVRADGTTPFVPEKGRYHLYVSLACPWSHRTVILRKLRKLEDVITLSVTNPIWNEKGWFFGEDPDAIPDMIYHKRDVADLYQLAAPSFEAEETVPILWDRKTKTIVNNESREIMRMLDHEFKAFGDPDVDLCPPHLQTEVDTVLTRIYEPINNGVYRAGFARNQRPYERAFKGLFQTLEECEEILAGSRYLCGNQLTEADVALFVTLIRFDVVYYSHFKCNLRRIIDTPQLWSWLRDVYQLPGVAETTNFRHIKAHYYGTHRNINPTGIIPLGPEIDFNLPHDRDRKFGGR